MNKALLEVLKRGDLDMDSGPLANGIFIQSSSIAAGDIEDVDCKEFK